MLPSIYSYIRLPLWFVVSDSPRMLLPVALIMVFESQRGDIIVNMFAKNKEGINR